MAATMRFAALFVVLLLVNAAMAQLVPRIPTEDIAGNDIYEQVKKTLYSEKNPAVIDSVQVMLRSMQDTLLAEQVEADRLYRSHHMLNDPKIVEWNNTVQELNAWLAGVDPRIANNTQAIQERMDYLEVLPANLTAKDKEIENQKKLIQEWLVPRTEEIFRFQNRVNDARETMVGINGIIDKLGKLNSEHYNSTLREVLNDHHKPSVASLLEVAATMAKDDLDEFRLMLRLLAQQLRAYIEDMNTSEADNNAFYEARKKNLTDDYDVMVNERNALAATNATKLNEIEELKNSTINEEVEKVNRIDALGVAQRHLSKLQTHMEIVQKAWEQEKAARDDQRALISRALELIAEKLSGAHFVALGPNIPSQNSTNTTAAPAPAAAPVNKPTTSAAAPAPPAPAAPSPVTQS